MATFQHTAPAKGGRASQGAQFHRAPGSLLSQPFFTAAVACAPGSAASGTLIASTQQEA